MKAMFKNLLIVLIAFASVIGLLYLAFFIVPQKFLISANQSQPSLVAQLASGVLITGAGFLALILFEPLRELLSKSVKEVFGIFTLPACRIFVFGHSGTGKTTLIRRVVALRQDGNEVATQGFHEYEMHAPLDLGSNKKIRVIFADYEGESPDEMFINPPAYFGIPGFRHVNVLIFMADPFAADPPPRASNETDDDFAFRINRLLDERRSDIEKYITKWTVKMAFKVCGKGEHLCAVRFVVNKSDLLHKYGTLLGIDDMDAFVKNRYKVLIEDIQKQCAAHNMSDRFSIWYMSGWTRENVDSLITGVFDLYQRYRGIEVHRD